MADRKALSGKKETYKPRLRKDSEVNPEEYDTVVLRNLDPSTEIGDIKHDLEQIGYRVLSIRNAFSHATGLALPLFFIKLYKNPFNATIFQLKYMAHQVVIVEEYLQGPDLPRCTRCQALDHTKDSCTNSPICAWCSGSHYTTTCKEVKISLPTCSRCGGCHPSSYKGCKVYRQKCLMKALEENNKSINSKQNSSELSISPTKIKEPKVPVTSACSTITSASSTYTSASSAITSAITKTTSVGSCITSPSSSMTFKSSITSPSSPITSPSSSRTFSSLFTSYSSSADEKLPVWENVKSGRASSPSEFSIPALPILDGKDLKGDMKVVADVLDHFSSMNKDLYLKLML